MWKIAGRKTNISESVTARFTCQNVLPFKSRATVLSSLPFPSFEDIGTEKYFSSGEHKADHQRWQALRGRGTTRLCKPTNVYPSQDSPALGLGVSQISLPFLKKLNVLTFLQNHRIFSADSVNIANIFAGPPLPLPADDISHHWVIVSSSCCHVTCLHCIISSDPLYHHCPRQGSTHCWGRPATRPARATLPWW